MEELHRQRISEGLKRAHAAKGHIPRDSKCVECGKAIRLHVEASGLCRACWLKKPRPCRDCGVILGAGPHRRCRACFRKRHHERLLPFKQQPCADCGKIYPPYVMDFDHVRGEKKFDISLSERTAWETVLAEIAKCDVVCANCHRERTWERAHCDMADK